VLYLDLFNKKKKEAVQDFISKKILGTSYLASKSDFNKIQTKGANAIGTVNTEETTSDSTSNLDTLALTDRSIKLTISRDKEGCEFAFDNDIAVASAVNRKVRLINTGFNVKIIKTFEDNKKYIKKAKEIEKEIKRIKLKKSLDTFAQNRIIHGFGIWKKLLDKEKKLYKLLTIPSLESKPIRDLSTGELGNKIINSDNGKTYKNTAFVQRGNVCCSLYF